MRYDLPVTQTSSMVALVSTLLVLVSFTSSTNLNETGLLGNFLKLIHLGSFSTWFGVQIWVTFFAGKHTSSNILLPERTNTEISNIYQ